ncbi:unnamed protein product [Gemmata massiliana]|uniref:Helix-turn-helix domain-containing protein n=2 Tax=Gemmata massiliana TaxID=1210884 RepID=A0A6P2CYE7_9BACT|nr:unnamed protein product [Gemmata massiliana]
MGRPAKPMFQAPTSEEICSEGALSPEGAAEFTSLSRTEIDRAIVRGEIETFRYGRRVLIAKREMVRWLADLRDKSLQSTGRI